MSPEPSRPAEPAEPPESDAPARRLAPELVEQLMPLMYEELRRMARRERRRVGSGDTLATTALVNETFLRLEKGSGFETRSDFLRAAARSMRFILVERVRAQLAQKRGGGLHQVSLDDAEDFEVEDDERIAAINDALGALAAVSPQLADLVECRFFGGFSEKETAEALGLSLRAVQRGWVTARAWLQRELNAAL